MESMDEMRGRIPSAGGKARENVRSGTMPEDVIRKRRKRLYQMGDIRSFFTRLIMMALLVYILFWKVFGLQPMLNEDMKPRLSAGDLLLYYRLETRLSTGNVVVLEKDGKTYIGRIIAKSGDKVEVTEDQTLKINDSTMIESEIFYNTPRYESSVQYPLTLGPDEYFILCDFRTGGKDSRYYGPVEESEIQGKVITVIRRSNL